MLSAFLLANTKCDIKQDIQAIMTVGGGGGGDITFNHLSDAFIQSDLQMRTMEAININKIAIICNITSHS